jgi:hypothetical protein
MSHAALDLRFEAPAPAGETAQAAGQMAREDVRAAAGAAGAGYRAVLLVGAAHDGNFRVGCFLRHLESLKSLRLAGAEGGAGARWGALEPGRVFSVRHGGADFSCQVQESARVLHDSGDVHAPAAQRWLEVAVCGPSKAAVLALLRAGETFSKGEDGWGAARVARPALDKAGVLIDEAHTELGLTWQSLSFDDRGAPARAPAAQGSWAPGARIDGSAREGALARAAWAEGGRGALRVAELARELELLDAVAVWAEGGDDAPGLSPALRNRISAETGLAARPV